VRCGGGSFGGFQHGSESLRFFGALPVFWSALSGGLVDGGQVAVAALWGGVGVCGCVGGVEMVAGLTLQEAYLAFRKDPPEAIPFWVWLMENPDSPLPFVGQVSLEHHDLIHVILGLGVSREEEAEVVGWTLGNEGIEVWEILLFLWVAMVLYPEPYQFRYQDLPFFFYGLEQGKSVPRLKLEQIDRSRPLAEIRAEVLKLCKL
jgi:hypothetical protein